MFNQKKIAIMGTGNIAKIMARTIKRMKNVKCYAVASRDMDRAQAFAKEFGVKRAYGSYEEMMADNRIDLVYIATPHSEHYANMKLCIENGFPVLCEKAFTANAEQAEEIFKLAEEKHVFVAEAMWTRYMPMLTTIKGLLASGMIGQPSMLTCNLGYHIVDVPRLTEPSLAGGALLDVGVYTLNFASMMFGTDVVKVDSSCILTPSGVDASNSITLTYRDGKMAVLNSTMLGYSDRRGIIYGTNGYIEIENINNYESVTVYDKNRKVLKEVKAPAQITGYEYEIASCLDALDKNATECWEMPHSETLRIMKMMDELRSKWGVRYPFEMAENQEEIPSQPEIMAAEIEQTEPANVEPEYREPEYPIEEVLSEETQPAEDSTEE